jgi:hypothetical protein
MYEKGSSSNSALETVHKRCYITCRIVQVVEFIDNETSINSLLMTMATSSLVPYTVHNNTSAELGL